MVKTLSNVSRRGLRDWMVQRVSAVIMAIYSIALIAYVVRTPNFSYAEWHGLFSQTWMKIATLMVLGGLLYHAWIGMWTVFTDYIKPFVIRGVLNTLMFLALMACFLWGLLILWSV